MNVDVVVATYNGDKYIRQQLESILQQTYKNFRVLIRDDGSSDNTVKIIKEISEKDTRVFLIEDNSISNGVGENFKILLSHCTAEYVFLSDQDDIWCRNKIEDLLVFAEKNFVPNEPCIAYAPGIVVDNDLNSLRKITDTKLKIRAFNDVLLMNGGVQGCAMVINKALYKRALKNDFFWYMHDQVLSMYSIAFGKIFFLPTPLFLYRQHHANVIGFNRSTLIDKMNKYLYSRNRNFLISKESMHLFINFFKIEGVALLEKDKMTLVEFFKYSSKNKVMFMFFIMKNNLKLKKSILRAILKTLLVSRIVG